MLKDWSKWQLRQNIAGKLGSFSYFPPIFFFFPFWPRASRILSNCFWPNCSFSASGKFCFLLDDFQPLKPEVAELYTLGGRNEMKICSTVRNRQQHKERNFTLVFTSVQHSSGNFCFANLWQQLIEVECNNESYWAGFVRGSEAVCVDLYLLKRRAGWGRNKLRKMSGTQGH